jgi:hypothetical protein
MERMDWGSTLTPEQKAKPQDNVRTNDRYEAMIRFGQVSAEDVSDDDDIIIVIAPQNGRPSFYMTQFLVSSSLVLVIPSPLPLITLLL